MPPKRVQTSGIQTTKSGERVIPASVRPDGTIRPERKVKQGYTPAEDIATYKNERAETFRTHQYGHKDYVPPGLAKPAESGDKKRRRPKKSGQEGEGSEKGGSNETSEQMVGTGQEDPEKKARALRKKIRAATELKERATRGDKLEDSQMAKIKMLEVFEKELAELNLGDTEDVQ
jgi:partner of Y14 and mago